MKINETLEKKYLSIKTFKNKGDILKACLATKNILENKKKFPLRIFSQIRYLEFCSIKKEVLLKNLETIELKIPSWMKEYFLRTALSISLKNDLDKKSVSLLRDLTAYTYGQKEKIKLIKRALKINPDDKKTISLLQEHKLYLLQV